MEPLRFIPIDVDAHADLCVKFRCDAFVSSFGTDQPFIDDDGKGPERYIEWLRTRTPARYGAFHVWLGDKIIGQLELGERSPEEEFGYVHLYYLIPEYRGEGYSDAIEVFAVTFLRNLGYAKAKLSVSPTNTRAVEFYKKNGWRDAGPRIDPQVKDHLKHPLHFMEKDLRD